MDDIHRLYDIFRPFGPLQLCITTGEGTAMIQYFNISDSEEAMAEMDGATLYDSKIKITPQPIDKDPNTPGMTPPSLSPPPLSPKDTLQQQDQDQQQDQQEQYQQEQYQQEQQHQQEQQSEYQYQYQQQDTPKTTPKPYVDYLNLYVKNMDPLITNDHLHALFGKFGKIISARVISNPATKQSRGYGFVSYSNEDDAARALNEMDGQIVFSKPLYISYHEPKKGRNDNNNNNNSSNNNNNNKNQYNVNNNNNNHYNFNFNNNKSNNTGNIIKNNHNDYSNVSNPDSSPSMNNNINIESDFNTLSVTTPPYHQQQYQQTVSPIVNLPRKRNPEPNNEYVHPSTAMIEEMNPYKNTATIKLPQSKNYNNQDNVPATKTPSPVFHGSPSNNTVNTPSLASLATGLSIQRPPAHMEHSPQFHYNPTDQQQHNNSYNRNVGHGTLRRRGSIESITSVMTDTSASLQRQKLIDAVNRCGNFDAARVTSIVDLLSTLKRKERSLCLFNNDFLKEKIEAALDALDTFDDDDDDDDKDGVIENNICYNEKSKGSNETTHKYLQNQQYYPQIYHEQKKSSPTQPSTFIPASNSFNTSNDITSLRRISKAIPILAPTTNISQTNFNDTSKLSHSNTNNNRLPVTPPTSNSSESKSNTMTSEEIDTFLDSISNLPLHTQKHQLGEIMWSHVKPLARPLAKNKKVPGFSSKVLIHLLDNVPLPELAHGINNNPWLQKQVEMAANEVHKVFTI
ncbi:unnamed protein product [Cunninghamella blakesleeana]